MRFAFPLMLTLVGASIVGYCLILFDNTVPTGEYRDRGDGVAVQSRVHNFGLMHKQSQWMTCGGTLAVVGLVWLALGSLMPQHRQFVSQYISQPTAPASRMTFPPPRPSASLSPGIAIAILLAVISGLVVVGAKHFSKPIPIVQKPNRKDKTQPKDDQVPWIDEVARDAAEEAKRRGIKLD